MHERLDETDLLAVALRERADRPVELELEPCGEPLAVAEVAHPPERREVAEVLARREALVETEVAGQVAKASAGLRAPRGGRRARRARPVPSWGRIRSSIRRIVVVFPAPFGPEVAEDLALFDLERQVGDAAVAAVVLRQVIGSDDRGRH